MLTREVNNKICVANIFNKRHQHRNIGHSITTKILNKFKTSGSNENGFKKKHQKQFANEDMSGGLKV